MIEAMLITKCGCTRRIKIQYIMPTLTIPFEDIPMMETEYCNITKGRRRDFKLYLSTGTSTGIGYSKLLIYREV